MDIKTKPKILKNIKWEKRKPSEFDGEEHHVDQEFPIQVSSNQINRTNKKLQHQNQLPKHN